MADEEQHLSKRERQKQRKRAKREAEEAAKRQQRTRKMLATGLVAAVAVAALGGVGFLWQQSRAERGDILSGDSQVAQAAGCGSVEEFDADDSPSHLGPDEYESLPPEELYDERPHTAGRHTVSVVRTGVWSKAIDERILGHNLEHGYVVAYASPDADETEVEALETAAQEAIDAGDDKLIVARWMNDEPMDEDASFAFVAWERRMLCDSFDEEVFAAFLDEHHGSFNAPEAGVDAHLGQGIDPDSYEEEELLLPPLDDNERLIQEATGVS